jgi:PucR family transcriptional regulator, purine catabolism regulatory protein
MPLNLAEVLAHSVLARGRPEVVCGDDLGRREVRWVHTSEIYEIGPLLKGGELLLTTGLGLVGKSDEQLEQYVADLAARGVTGLVLELGRTFTVVPPALRRSAEAHGLPLVVLHGVVPFIEVTEQVHHLLIDSEVAVLRQQQEVDSELLAGLLTGAGLGALVRRIAHLAECPATVYAGDGRLVASSRDVPEDGPEEVPERTVERAVPVFGVDWGRLVLHGDDNSRRQAVLDRGVVAVSLELVRTGTLAPARQTARRELMRDIATGQFRSASDLSARAHAVGVAARGEERLLVVCVGLAGGVAVESARGAASEAARQVLGPALVTDVDGDLLMAGRVSGSGDATVRAVLRQIADTIDSELQLTHGGRVAYVVSGPVVAEVPGLVRSTAVARDASRILRGLGGGRQVVMSADVGVYRLLSRLVDDPELETFVAEQIGALLEYDARHGRELVRTLDVYLAQSLSKSRTAAALGIRRQTLYARLERISALLGGLDLDQRERRAALDLALTAWRLRTSAMAR